MEDYESIPAIEWGEDCSYDTLHSIITGWCARIWVAGEGTSRTILIARWDGGSGDETNLMVWSEKDQDYCVPVTVKTGKIVRISIL